ncbi:M24 family metallopeptidase [Jeotgalibacillus haloalkalitolerans]|uniref:Xaa-Pro peptidase family protein n=1 Tax=Jeotgalibacillus haloalkalitolerans TaxID=3104292 RepID=A0ABU5KMH0_9BACL|nr:Xaa-Pro peptidase family protein [Jeotgalibacillus sp. HH7-29]MDZ5712463.1 Xaa-Pro peptidase family protein [Jeotgalibacillus sp. HH7-29]
MIHMIEKIQAYLKDEQIDCAFLTSTENVTYTTGFRSDPHERWLAVYIPADGDAILICPGMEVEDARGAGWEGSIIGYSDTESPLELLKAGVSGFKRVAIEKNHLTVERLELFHQVFGECQVHAAEHMMNDMRVIKSDEEVTLLKKAAELADFAIETACSELEEGRTELEVLAKVEYELKKKGITEMSFSTMVLTGENASSPHGTPGDTRIKKGDLVLFDLGVVYKGYCSDITRTVAFGEISDQQQEIYKTVLKAEMTALEMVKPGVKSSDLDLAARKVIEDAGYGDYFPHRLGHGLGLNVHEYPSITSESDIVLKKGMTFTIEPGIYLPGVAGVRIEDDVLVTENGYETLTKFPKTLQTY